MNITKTLIAVTDPDITECWNCGSTTLAGQVNGRFGFCSDHQQAVIDGFAELASYGGVDTANLAIDLELIPTGQTVFDTQYAELAKRAEAKARRIKADTAELEKIKAQLRDLGKGSYIADGRTIVTVGETPRRFDESLARSVLPLEQQAQVTKTVIDGQAVKALFGDDVYDSCRKDQGGKATVKFPGVE